MEGWSTNLALAATLSLLLIAAYTDVTRGLIFNWLTLLAMALGLGLHTSSGGSTGVLSSLAGLVLGAGLLLVPVLAGGPGMGDVKLLAAVGALQGPSFVFTTFLGMAALVGTLALLSLVRRRRLLAFAAHFVAGRGVLVASDSPRFPYALAIAAGAFAALLLKV